LNGGVLLDFFAELDALFWGVPVERPGVELYTLGAEFLKVI
jgi:hypothetical protein